MNLLDPAILGIINGITAVDKDVSTKVEDIPVHFVDAIEKTETKMLKEEYQNDKEMHREEHFFHAGKARDAEQAANHHNTNFDLMSRNGIPSEKKMAPKHASLVTKYNEIARMHKELAEHHRNEYNKLEDNFKYHLH